MQASAVVGRCMQMCPQEEIIMRERENLLHRFEVIEGSNGHKKPKADRKCMVKTFSRSAAGKKLHSPNILRPPEVLLKTINYLLEDVLMRETSPFNVVYDFIVDRLQSIRQDMVIQDLPRAPSISILQPIVRFHALVAYKMCNMPIHRFDPVLNNKHLQECLKKLLVLYDESDLFEERCAQKGIKLDNYEAIFVDDRPVIEALYLLHNLGDPVAILRGVGLKRKWRAGLVSTALKISMEFWRGNWIKVCIMMVNLPSLLAATAALHLPKIRRKAFEVMCTAYNSKQLWNPLDQIQATFLYTYICDVICDFRHYGITMDKEEYSAHFIKGEFQEKKKVVPPRHEDFITNKLANKRLTDMVLYGQL